jgi:hypothetical protein
VVKVDRGGYEEPVTVPKAVRETLAAAVAEAVKQGKLWLTSGPASILGEEIPAGLLTDDAKLQAPPSPIPATDLMPSSLPEVWTSETTTALAIAVALSRKANQNLPWTTVRQALDGAIRARSLETTLDSTPWPCEFAAAQNVKLRVATASPRPIEMPFALKPDVLVAEAELRPSEIQDLAEQLPEIRKAAGSANLKFRLHLELDGRGSSAGQNAVGKINELLAKISKALSLR